MAITVSPGKTSWRMGRGLNMPLVSLFHGLFNGQGEAKNELFTVVSPITPQDQTIFG